MNHCCMYMTYNVACPVRLLGTLYSVVYPLVYNRTFNEPSRQHIVLDQAVPTFITDRKILSR